MYDSITEKYLVHQDVGQIILNVFFCSKNYKQLNFYKQNKKYHSKINERSVKGFVYLFNFNCETPQMFYNQNIFELQKFLWYVSNAYEQQKRLYKVSIFRYFTPNL